MPATPAPSRRPLYIALAGLTLLLLFHRQSWSTPTPDSARPSRLAAALLRPFVSSCPVPWNPRATVPLAQQSLQCENVPTNSSDYAVELCVNRDVCNQGHLDVTLLDQARCRQLETTPRSTNAIEDAYIKALGPHTFAIFLDGPERVGLEHPEYLGDCRYRYAYHLHNGGRFALRVILLYDEYKGLDTLHQGEWQPIINQSILPADYLSPLSSCSSSCTRYQASSYIPTRQPPCARDAPVTGSWLPSFPAVDTESISPVKFGTFPPYAFVPHHCALELTSIDYLARPRDRALCFGRPQRILLTGDSHLRWLYDGLIQKLQGSLAGREPGSANFGKATEKDCKIGGLTADYFTDPVLASLRDEVGDGGRYATATHIVLSAVQWLMHQPYAEYQTHIDLLLHNIALYRSRNRNPARFIWFASPAWPHRDDEDVRSHNDTRTNARLRQMNNYAIRRFREEGYASVDSMALSIGFTHSNETPDNAHYYGTAVMEAMHQLVAHRLDLCQ